ncbi:MAG TPA: Crp/Fnr family transcriptional regulator [Bryobacteraceae bacterium]|nr:Crp/Fnr family transcriptional regulator [Bryobacteraceae bacterium]
MEPTTATAESHARLEDLLAHLPASNLTDYRKGHIIYGPQQPSKGFYLVSEGKVQLSQVGVGGREILLDIIGPEELFGESAFRVAPGNSERATAHENTSVMTWSTSEIEYLVTRRPRLAVALLQVIAQRNAELTSRIESLAVDSIEQRLARSLIRFSERLGTPEENGSVKMLPLTHRLLSRYVGTSREIVSHYMNQFRKRGYVTYSRTGIQLYRDALKASITQRSFSSAERTN